MDTDYTTYTAGELLDDDCFLHAELHPTAESRAFWNRLHDESPALAAEMDVARELLHGIRRSCHIKQDLPHAHIEALREKIDRQNRRHDRQHTRHLHYLRAAAGIAAAAGILLAAGWYARLARQQDATDYEALTESFARQAGGDESGHVRLALSDNRTIAIDGKETQIDYHETGRVTINSGQHVEEETKNETVPAYNQLTVPPGKRSLLTFNDGTRVWINSCSRIIYPVTFEKNRREIFVEGEIYLDVAGDAKRPFVVKTGSMDVKALGTAFNVKTCSNESGVEVVLVSGKVEVGTDGNRNILAPNQLFSYNSRTGQSSVVPVDVADYIAWKDGYYPFRRQRLDEVLHKLAGYYGIAFHWDTRIDSLTCSGKLDLKEDLDEVLRTLEKTAPVTIRKTNANVYEINVKP